MFKCNAHKTWDIFVSCTPSLYIEIHSPMLLSNVYFLLWHRLHFNVILVFFSTKRCTPTLQSFTLTSVIEREEGKRQEEAVGAPSLFHPLLHNTSLSFVWVYALIHSHNSLLRLLEDAVWECEVLSRGCPSTSHLPLIRALCFCAAHVTAIVPN